jgi:hypothetical protein
MKFLAYLIPLCILASSCGATQKQKVKTALDASQGVLIAADLLVRAAEENYKFETPADLTAIIEIKEGLLLASELLLDAYDLLETNPESALEYAACAVPILERVYVRVQRFGIKQSRYVSDALEIARQYTKGVVCPSNTAPSIVSE